ncbi:MAG: hypothetical protein SGJ18_10620, partial [Pseudomonadota bacterium]|nr:hypothetical protein [Pseudomonadota bacterium]
MRFVTIFFLITLFLDLPSLLAKEKAKARKPASFQYTFRFGISWPKTQNILLKAFRSIYESLMDSISRRR